MHIQGSLYIDFFIKILPVLGPVPDFAFIIFFSRHNEFLVALGHQLLCPELLYFCALVIDIQVEIIELILGWVDEPVALYGHSAGAGGAIIAAFRNPDRIKILFLEACYARTEEALLSLYRWFNPMFGMIFGPMIIFWMNLFYGNQLDVYSPARLAPAVKMPVLLIHGENDRRFPLPFARTLRDSFTPGQADLYVAKGVGHSDSSKTPGYQEAVRLFLERHWNSP